MLYSIIGENVFGLVQLMNILTIAFLQMMQFTVEVLTKVKFKHLGQLLSVLLIKHQVAVFCHTAEIGYIQARRLNLFVDWSYKIKELKIFYTQRNETKSIKSICSGNLIWRNGKNVLLRAAIFYTYILCP